MLRRIIYLFVISIHCLLAFGHSADFSKNQQYLSFVNKSLDISHFEFFFQDSIGRIWGGSYNDGVMMFDGESFVKKTPAIGTYGIHYSIAILGSDYLIGSRAGLYKFNLRSLKLTLVPQLLAEEVTGLHKLNSREVVVFCANRILLYELDNGNIDILFTWSGYRIISHQLLPDGTFLLLSDLEGLFSFDYENHILNPIPLNDFSVKDELLLCMQYDNGSLWLGSDQGLLKCNLQTHQVVRISPLNGISIKALMKARSGSIWVGTNSGLYVFDPGPQTWTSYRHSTQNDRSLLNDCVWCMFEDAEGNKWLGVDGGISFIPHKKYFSQIKWEDLINSIQGNRITHILHDSQGNYWLGGTNGLGYHNTITGESIFFKMQGKHRIPNNTIRNLYEDKKGIIWISTDGGPAWFDKKKKEFVFSNVTDKISGRNAVWTYGICEDNDGNMWIATCSGGIFVINRNDLATKRNLIYSDFNFSTLSNTHKINYDACSEIISDLRGNLWINADRWLYKIDNHQNKALYNPEELVSIPTKNMIDIICDEKGDIWGAYRDALFKVNQTDNELETIDISNYSQKYGNIYEIISYGDYIWFLTSNSVAAFHKETHQVEHIINLAAGQYKSFYYDKQNEVMWLGGMDNCTILYPEKCLKITRNIDPASIISEIYVNGKPVSPLYNASSSNVDAAYCKQLKLKPNENSIAFRISTGILPCETERKSGYYYRIKELDETWKVLTAQHPLVEYPYLSYGTYHLEFSKQTDSSQEAEIIRTLDITIQAPWYYSIWFRILIAIVLIALFVAFFNNYRVKTKLQIAEIDKQKTLALSQMKMEFLTNMSHELKTPLSLIMGSVNKLLGTTRNAQSKALLQTIQKNVMKLNALIVQIINFKDTTSQSSNNTLSRLEAVEFVRSIISIYQETCQSKGLSIEFKTELEKESVYINADPLKLESIINNLLSNAYKFTPPEGKIVVEVKRQYTHDHNELLKLSISDTGTGIPKEDLPYIFDRFFQSEQTIDMNKDGSGIGLTMVKNYIAQHNGKINVESETGRGTTFTILLPIAQTEDPIQPASVENPTGNGLRILIVEDNVEIARFIADNLTGMECTVVHNGKSGLETAMKLLPDIIIADIMMPIMDGVEMSRLLKQNLTTATIPIILLTAKDNKQTELDAYKQGVDAFLSKPFEIEHLIARITQITNSKSLLIRKTYQEQSRNILPEELMKESTDEKILTKITNIIERHLQDSTLNVQKLAKLSGLNEKQIYRKIKILTGNTAVDYIKSIRLKKAALLLSQKKFTVNEVMYMVGFSSQSYFAKCFAEKYRKTPKVYMDETSS
jgi:signal transduction histidine kinase/DNA-binding response OmpR family regulator/ligand-binding sensor domain-containing protein